MVRRSCQSRSGLSRTTKVKLSIAKTLIYTGSYLRSGATPAEKSEIYLLKLLVSMVDSLEQEVASLVQKQSS